MLTKSMMKVITFLGLKRKKLPVYVENYFHIDS